MSFETTDSSPSTEGKIPMLPFPGDNFTRTVRHTPYPAIALQSTDLRGRIVFVSGATGVLGRAAAIALAQSGARGLVLTAREGKMDTLKEVEDIILYACKEHGSITDILKLPLDTLSPSSISLAVSSVKEKFGTIDTLLNISGVIDSSVPMSTSDQYEWWTAVETNLKGTWSITRALLPLLQASESPIKWIVNYASTAAFYNLPVCSGYSISKLALLRLTEMLSEESLSSFGIMAVAVHPGTVPSPITAHAVPSALKHIIVDPPELSAQSIVWLVKEKREWLSGRFVSCTWDMSELEQKREEILKKDLLKIKFSFV